MPVASCAFLRRFARLLSVLLDSLAYLGIPIFQRALLAGCVLAALLALLGVLVTARDLACLGDGLSHAAFGGIALGMFLGLSSPLMVAIPFTALAAVASAQCDGAAV